jgi:fatty-acyl-CoA synthase
MLAYSLAHGPTLTPLIERTIGDVFDAAVEKWPAREAVVSRHERERYSYRALQVEVNRLASALLNLGLLPGDRIAIWSHNNIAWLLMQLATAKASIILVNINPAYRVSELEYALNKSGCKAIVNRLSSRAVAKMESARQLIRFGRKAYQFGCVASCKSLRPN